MYHSMVGVTDYVWVNDVVLTSAARLLFVYMIMLFEWVRSKETVGVFGEEENTGDATEDA